MLFRFGEPTTAQFYMFHTRLPLTVAFFDRDGAYVSARDMPPCTAAKGSDCPVYGAERSYVDALEVVQGGLGALGVAPGSRVEVGTACSRSPERPHGSAPSGVLLGMERVTAPPTARRGRSRRGGVPTVLPEVVTSGPATLFDGVGGATPFELPEPPGGPSRSCPTPSTSRAGSTSRPSSSWCRRLPRLGPPAGRPAPPPDADRAPHDACSRCASAGTGSPTPTPAPPTTPTARRSSRCPPTWSTWPATRSPPPTATPATYAPDAVIANLYAPGARLGLHCDGEEPADAPVVTISLGDTCLFRFAGVDRRTAPFVDLWLRSGDLLVFGGDDAAHLPRRAEGAAGHGAGRARPAARPAQHHDPRDGAVMSDWLEQLDERGYARTGAAPVGGRGGRAGRRLRRRSALPQPRPDGSLPLRRGRLRLLRLPAAAGRRAAPPASCTRRWRRWPTSGASRLGAAGWQPWPGDLDGMLARCHAAGQDRPTPLVLRYGPGGYNTLHQDLYGDVAFPLQVVVGLTEPGVDYTGGEFVLTEQRPRSQTRATALVLGGARGSCSRTTAGRCGGRGPYQVTHRHGASEVRSGGAGGPRPHLPRRPLTRSGVSTAQNGRRTRRRIEAASPSLDRTEPSHRQAALTAEPMASHCRTPSSPGGPGDVRRPPTAGTARGFPAHIACSRAHVGADVGELRRQVGGGAGQIGAVSQRRATCTAAAYAASASRSRAAVIAGSSASPSPLAGRRRPARHRRATRPAAARGPGRPPDREVLVPGAVQHQPGDREPPSPACSRQCARRHVGGDGAGEAVPQAVVLGGDPGPEVHGASVERPSPRANSVTPLAMMPSLIDGARALDRWRAAAANLFRSNTNPAPSRNGAPAPAGSKGRRSPMRAYELMVIFDGDLDEPAAQALGEDRSPTRSPPRRQGARQGRLVGEAALRLRDQAQDRGLLRRLQPRRRARCARRLRALAPSRGRRRPPQADPPARRRGRPSRPGRGGAPA